jgi:deoxyuridine 5'-triphosphate nucleotidohydrolase
MLISFEEINKVLIAKNINVTGALHLGAHECEELSFYNQLSLKNEDVIWVDAINAKVVEAQTRGIPNVYHAVITDKDDEDVVFNVSNNVQSSSVLEFGTHSQEHPWVVYVNKLHQKSVTIDTFFKRNHLDASKYNFWSFDIQGAEFMALNGAIQSIQHAKAIYLEVNERELYINCGLITDIDTFLATYNFKRVLTNMTQYGWGDALYIHMPPASVPVPASVPANAIMPSCNSAHYVLYLQVPTDLREMYESAAKEHNAVISAGEHCNAGFDLFCPDALEIASHETVKIDQGVKGAMEFFAGDAGGVKGLPVGYFMYPRSSTGTKTPLRLANSIGIIDAGYRGNFGAVFDNCKAQLFEVERGQRLVQICPPNLTYPMRVVLVDNLAVNTLRGAGGFGSTGK